MFQMRQNEGIEPLELFRRGCFRNLCRRPMEYLVTIPKPTAELCDLQKISSKVELCRDV